MPALGTFCFSFLPVGIVILYHGLANYGEAGDIRPLVSTKTILIATTILGFVGVAKSIFPAVRGAKLDSIEALAPRAEHAVTNAKVVTCI